MSPGLFGSATTLNDGSGQLVAMVDDPFLAFPELPEQTGLYPGPLRLQAERRQAFDRLVRLRKHVRSKLDEAVGRNSVGMRQDIDVATIRSARMSHPSHGHLVRAERCRVGNQIDDVFSGLSGLA